MGTKPKSPKVNAKQLVDLLASRHARDVFVPECKTGPTQGVDGMQRMDAWALKKSWAHPLATAYEIKISRQDFLSDNKWRGYLPFCNEFLFVAPPGVIETGEVPEDAGLLVCSANATRLYRKKKAPYRNVEIPDCLYSYVLFSRVKVMREWHDHPDHNSDFWRQWLAGKRELKQLGWRVRGALRKRLQEEIDRRDTKQHDLERENERLAAVGTMLTNLGFAPGHIPMEYQVRDKLRDIKRGVPERTLRLVKDAEETLRRTHSALEALTTESSPQSADPFGDDS
jgi:hypothetical protein